MDNTERLMTTNEVAEMIPCSVQTVRTKVKEGKIPATTLGEGGSYRFKREDIETYLNGGKPVEKEEVELSDVDYDLQEASKELELANKEVELRKINNSLLSREEIDETLDEVIAKEANVTGREQAVVLAGKELDEEKKKAFDELDAKDKALEEKWGSAKKAGKDLADRETKVDAKETEIITRETEANKKAVQAEDLIRVINLKVIEYCGGDVLGIIVEEVNRIVLDRRKRKAYAEPIETSIARKEAKQ